MKVLIALMMSAFAFSALAGDSVSSVVSGIEADRNVRCDYVKSSMEFCFGMPRELATCRYTKTYRCDGAESFTLKLKVKNFYNTRTDARESVVTKVEIL